MVGIHSTVEKRAKRTPDIIVETTYVILHDKGKKKCEKRIKTFKDQKILKKTFCLVRIVNRTSFTAAKIITGSKVV